MGGVERVGDFDGGVQHLLQPHRLALDAVLERLAVEVLHHDEMLAVEFANIVDGANVRVVQGGGGAGLAQEAVDGLLIAGESSGRNFTATKRPRRVSSAL